MHSSVLSSGLPPGKEREADFSPGALRLGCVCSGCSPASPQGTLIQHLKEHVLHGNMGSGDILLYYTTVSGLRGVPGARRLSFGPFRACATRSGVW